MKARIVTFLFLLHIPAAWADCADLNRQAEPNKAALQAATAEYKSGIVSGLRATLSSNSPPPMAAIAQGVAETSKMITAMDKMIDYLQSVMSAGCFGKETNAWSAAIAKFQAQRNDMGKDRRLYIETLLMMSKVEDKPRN